MKFQAVKAQIKSILEAAEAGRYMTVGSKKQSKGASENVNLPRVVVYFSSGNFPKSSSSYEVDKQHECTFTIEFTVIEFTSVNLAVLDNPASTPAQLSTALSAAEDASDRADDAMDQVYSDVYNVLMDAEQINFGLTEQDVRDRYIDNFQKGDPLKKGQYVALSGSCQLTCTVTETVGGETGVPIASNDTTVNIGEDQGDNMGVITA